MYEINLLLVVASCALPYPVDSIWHQAYRRNKVELIMVSLRAITKGCITRLALSSTK
jgi:hypothetical protein